MIPSPASRPVRRTKSGLPVHASGPISTATPANASAIPANRSAVNRSTPKPASTSTVITGVAAFRIAASPLVTRVSAQANSANGMTLLSKPITRKARHGISIRPPRSRTSAYSTGTASAVRPSTMVKVGKSAASTRNSRNAPPHGSDSVTSKSQASAVRLCGFDMIFSRMLAAPCQPRPRAATPPVAVTATIDSNNRHRSDIVRRGPVA